VATSYSHTITKLQQPTKQASWPIWFSLFLFLTAFLSIVIVAAFALAVDHWNLLTFVVAVLIFVNALWISGGAATAVLGVMLPRQAASKPPRAWSPVGCTAILVTVCGEDPTPLANYLASFTRKLKYANLHQHTRVFVISDTTGAVGIDNELNALSTLINDGSIRYRRRSKNLNKKPGNIADWLQAHGSDFDYMIVKDADSCMTHYSIRELIWRLEQSPYTGLMQAAIALTPGRTAFGQHQRTSSRLLSDNFAHGFAAWSGTTGNYWGHNAIMRIEAFRAAVPLPCLPGKAPLGGDLLSHDFVEAAWIRRAGWEIELVPDIRGTAEDAPQTLRDFFRRDRRWCQGNLQHLRLLTQPGLHPLSRLHLVTGAFSYLSAPIWLLLLLLLSVGSVPATSLVSLLLVVAVLFIPKVCALVSKFKRAKTTRRRHVILRAWAYEIGLSTLLGPLISLQNAKSVCAIVMGHDCGWKSSSNVRLSLPDGWFEASIGLLILLLSLSYSPLVAAWLSPITVPLIISPYLIRTLNEESS